MRNAQCIDARSLEDALYDAASDFVRSSEYLSRKRTDIEYVGDLYDGILRRGATPFEINYWKNILSLGISRMQILKFFVSSPEFQFRVAAVINEGCLL